MRTSVMVFSTIVLGIQSLAACKVPATDTAGELAAADAADAKGSLTDTTYFPYAGNCDPLSGPCNEGDFEWWKVQDEFRKNFGKDNLDENKYKSKVPAWGPHTFHCNEFRASLDIPFHEFDDRGGYLKYYVGVSSHIGASCGDVIRLTLNGKSFRYMVTDVCPAYHPVQGQQKHCQKPNIDVSHAGIKEQLGRLDNTSGQARYKVVCRASAKTRYCKDLSLGPVD